MNSSINFPTRCDFSNQGQSVFNRSPTLCNDNWGHSSGSRKIIAFTPNGGRIRNLRRVFFKCGGPHLVGECPRRKSTKVMAPQDKARNLDEGLDNIYGPLNILDEVDDGTIEVVVGTIKVKPICFVLGVSYIDHLYLEANIDGHACNAILIVEPHISLSLMSASPNSD